MEDANLLCDFANCGKVARHCGIKSDTKEKSCDDHMQLLSNKKMLIFDIAGYRFVSSFEDVSIYQDRRNRVEQGLGNLIALEAQCDTESFEAMALLRESQEKAITILVRSFEEIRLQIEQKYDALKQQLHSLRGSFEQYLESKQTQLQGGALLLCENPLISLKYIRLMIEDCSLSIAKAVAGSWTASQSDAEVTLSALDEQRRKGFAERLKAESNELSRKGHYQLAYELCVYAQSLGWLGDIREARRASLGKQIEDLEELEGLFRLAINLSADEITHLQDVAAQCFDAGVAAKADLHIPESQRWLKIAWNLLQKHAIERDMLAVGLRLGEVLGLYSGRYAEAEQILRRCFEISAQLDPLSEETMKVGNRIAGLMYHSGRWSSAAEICEWVLCRFRTTSHAAEHFWTSLQYLTFSYYYQDKGDKAQTLIEEWRKTLMQGESALSEVLKLIVFARCAQKQGSDTEAEKYWVNALALTEMHLPTSELFALEHRYLGSLYDDLKQLDAAERHCMKAKSLYEEMCPLSVEAAKNLSNMGLLYDKLKLSKEAKKQYKGAKAIYEAVNPSSLEAAINMCSMGVLYFHLGKFNKAEACYSRAKEIYNNVCPESVHAASNFYNLGGLYEAMRNIEGAIIAFEAARDIYTKNLMDSDAKDANDRITHLHKMNTSLVHRMIDR